MFQKTVELFLKELDVEENFEGVIYTFKVFFDIKLL